jgi:heat shock protein HslJ
MIGMRFSGRGIIAGVAACGLFLTACSSGGGGGSGTASQNPDELVGQAWVLTQYLASNGTEQIVSVGVKAEFDGNNVSGTSGCNVYNGPYTATGNEISFGAMSGTKKMCPPDVMAVETRYLELLAGAATYRISGRSMSMSDADGTPTLQFSKG